MQENVILVDTNDCKIGIEEKLRAHEEGLLHRAFSIFVFNSKGELLIHKRASSKYHTPGLWTNTCCSHPRPQESLEDAVHRRLQEEMGFDCPLAESFSFIYKAKFEGEDMIEYEFDHVFIGTADITPKPNPNEVEDYEWISIPDLEAGIKVYPEKYTYWLKHALSKVIEFRK